jgi:3-oxoacyl-[acyl-carrier-protein] synthase-1
VLLFCSAGDGSILMIVTAQGMVTSVGSDAFTACASIRAGLTRPQLLEDFPMGNLETMEESFLVGHPVAGLTDGFVLFGRWSLLLDRAITSLWSTSQVPGPDETRFWQSTALIVVLPRLGDARFCSEEEDATSLIESAREKLCGSAPVQGSTILPGGRVALASAFRLAGEMLSARRCARVLVAAVDSYLDPLSIDWLWRAGRLKLSDAPAGLSPGEAGACLLVEADWAARERGARTIFHVRGLGEAKDPDAHTDRDAVGRGLAKAALSSLAEAGITEAFCGDIVSDHNGESWRAIEYGGACTLLKSRFGTSIREIFPAQSIGDVGAASAAVALCVAGRSFVRGYASSHKALVLCSTEFGESAALLVTSS